MEDVQNYEKFPSWIPILSNIFGLSVYAIGIYLITGFGTLWAILYLIYCLWVEIEVVRKSCVDCYYYGKVCGMGKGKLCALLFKKGDPKRFVERELTWFDMLPDLMVFVFPILGGIILLVRDFNWVTVAMMTILVILFTAGNVFIRGSLVCRSCKQREIGCPAQKIFAKEEQ